MTYEQVANLLWQSAFSFKLDRLPQARFRSSAFDASPKLVKRKKRAWPQLPPWRLTLQAAYHEYELLAIRSTTRGNPIAQARAFAAISFHEDKARRLYTKGADAPSALALARENHVEAPHDREPRGAPYNGTIATMRLGDRSPAHDGGRQRSPAPSAATIQASHPVTLRDYPTRPRPRKRERWRGKTL